MGEDRVGLRIYTAKFGWSVENQASGYWLKLSVLTDSLEHATGLLKAYADQAGTQEHEELCGGPDYPCPFEGPHPYNAGVVEERDPGDTLGTYSPHVVEFVDSGENG